MYTRFTIDHATRLEKIAGPRALSFYAGKQRVGDHYFICQLLPYNFSISAHFTLTILLSLHQHNEEKCQI